MTIRVVDVVRITRKVGVKNLYGSRRNASAHFLGSAGVRILLIVELVAFTVAGDFWAWALQFLAMIEARKKGKVLYPHRVKRSSQVPFADQLLRKILSSQPDQSIVMVQVGYFSNLAVLLETPGDEISPLTGRELVRRKVRLLSVMA